MSRQKTPHLKLISGTRRPGRPERETAPPLTSAPEAPAWLPNVHARQEWERLTHVLMANKVLTEGWGRLRCIPTGLAEVHLRDRVPWLCGERNVCAKLISVFQT